MMKTSIRPSLSSTSIHAIVPALVAAIVAGLGLIFARDNGVSSEQAGAK